MVRSSRIGLICAGGTIATRAQGALDYVEYGISAELLTSEALADEIPLTLRDIEVIPLDFAPLQGPQMRMQDVARLARAIKSAADGGDCDGFVVAHGTATLEETAFLLHLWLEQCPPVVVVGAQRPLGSLSSDAPLALVHALQTAASLRESECVVVLNGTIHSPRTVTKEAAYALDAFRSGTLGELGRILPTGSVMLSRRPPPNPRHFGLGWNIDRRQWPRVPIVYGALDMESVFDIAPELPLGGIVSAAMAPGFMSGPQELALDEMRGRGVIEVRSLRRGVGPVVRDRRLADRGIVAGGFLTPHHCRHILMSVGEDGQSPPYVQALVDELSGFTRRADS